MDPSVAVRFMSCPFPDVDRMLHLNETLFVDHKAGIGENDSFKLLEAIAAFANTAGGWLLLGVENNQGARRSELAIRCPRPHALPRHTRKPPRWTRRTSRSNNDRPADALSPAVRVVEPAARITLRQRCAKSQQQVSGG